MRLDYTILRRASAGMLVLLAGLAALASYAAYSDLEPGRAYMRLNAARFQATARFVIAYSKSRGAFPDEAEIRQWASRQGYDAAWSNSVSGDRVGGNSYACSDPEEVGFTVPRADVFVLSRWRGEWFDCYSLPSGTNNVVHPLTGDTPAYHIICWLFAFGFLAIAWLVKPKRQGSSRPA